MRLMSRRFSAVLVCSVALLLSAVARRAPAGGSATQPVDMIATNDLLCVGIWDVRPTGGETLKTVRVDELGNISLYYVGQLRVAGRSFEQAEKEIGDAYRASNLLQNAIPSINRLETGATVSVASGPIAVGDRFSVRVLDLIPYIEECRVLKVSDGGKVGLPLLGQFKMAGLTEADAEKAISRAYEEQFELRNIPVSVLRLGPKQQAEPTTVGEPNSRRTQQLPRTTR